MNTPQKTIDPDLVPKRVLYTGAEMPAVGLGTFGSDRITHQQVADAVMGAARIGYRHFDCASVYGNESVIGKVLTQIQQEIVPRDKLWITSKVWNNMHGKSKVIESCKKSLQDLQLDYLDLYLVHWPFPNFHPPKCDVSSRSPDARPYIHDEFMDTWSGMEDLVEMGLVKTIGTSNVTISKLERIIRDANIKPAANEMELHPHFQQPELFQYVKNQGIVPIGYSPVGSPARPERDRTPEDTVDIEDPVIVEIARNHGIHPATLCVKWAEQRGQVPIPFSTTPRNYYANLESVTTAPLTEAEMVAIAKIDKGCRLIKGQVFLWEGASGWEALWD